MPGQQYIKDTVNLEKLKRKYPDTRVLDFGDSRELSDELISLVGSGRETTTCSALRDFIGENEKLPEVGGKGIVINRDGTPALVIEIVTVAQKRFCDIGEKFALAEGKNDTSTGWRRDHKSCFERNGGFDNQMISVCQRFKVIEGFG